PPPRSSLFPYTTLFRSSGPFDGTLTEIASFSGERILEQNLAGLRVGHRVKRAQRPEILRCGDIGALRIPDLCQGAAHEITSAARSEEHTSELQSPYDLV